MRPLLRLRFFVASALVTAPLVTGWLACGGTPSEIADAGSDTGPSSGSSSGSSGGSSGGSSSGGGTAAPPVTDAAEDPTTDAAQPIDAASAIEAGALGPIDRSSAAIYAVFPAIYSQAGNLAAVSADLPRIRDFGFNVIYLMPVTPIGQATGGHPSVGSPYAVHDYYALNPAYGGTQDLVTLVHSAHALGLHVILDEVLNHTAWDSALLTLHPEYYVHSDGNSKNVASIEEAFNFADVAQLDYKTPANGLAKYMSDMLISWVKTYDVDGFRFDTADDPFGSGRMIPATFWQALRPQLEAVKSGILMLGEEEDPALADAPFELDYGWNLQGLNGAGGLRQVATGGNASQLQMAWTTQQTGYPAGMRHMTLLQEWDLDEDLNLYGGTANTMAAATFNFTIDGLPLLFNGEEVGNDRSGVNTHTVIDWAGPNAATFAPFYKSLLSLRSANSALQQGAVTWLNNSAAAHVVTYTRSDAKATFLVAINFSNATASVTLSPPTSSGWTDVSPAGSPGAAAHSLPPALTLKPYDFAIFRAK